MDADTDPGVIGTREPDPVARRPMPTMAFGAAWVLSRLLMLANWYTTLPRSVTDPTYYLQQLTDLGTRAGLREYPLPVVWLMDAVRLSVGGRRVAFLVGWALLMEAVDLGWGVRLWRGGFRAAAWFWLLVGPLLGATLVWFRFDVLAAVLVGVAVLECRRRPGLTGAALALGAWVKLWPVLLVAALWRPGRAGRRLLAAGLGLGIALGAAVAVANGPGRLLTPLTWQGDRGLQVESVAATPFMLARALGSDRWTVHRTRFHAQEVSGPGVALVAHCMSVLLLAVVGVAVVMLWRSRWRSVDPAMGAVALCALLLVGDKALSPQYVLWVAAPMAALVAVRGRRQAASDADRGQRDRRPGLVAGLALAVLVAAALTHVVYPDHYGQLTTGRSLVIALVLATRNLLLTGVAMVATLSCLGARSGWTRRPSGASDTCGRPAGAGE